LGNRTRVENAPDVTPDPSTPRTLITCTVGNTVTCRIVLLN